MLISHRGTSRLKSGFLSALLLSTALAASAHAATFRLGVARDALKKGMDDVDIEAILNPGAERGQALFQEVEGLHSPLYG